MVLPWITTLLPGTKDGPDSEMRDELGALSKVVDVVRFLGHWAFMIVVFLEPCGPADGFGKSFRTYRFSPSERGRLT
jgi:hypothetical protein